jgi:DNA invertase Pin-like site-specific DNA recombinase
MSDSNSTALFRGVGYFRKSKDEQTDSIEQQLAWANEVCPARNISLAATFTDEGKSGHATSKRTDYHRMLRYCQEEYRAGRPIDVIVCWHTNRFSRADSQETGWFIWEYRKVDVNRMFTNAGWLDFRDRTTRAIFGIDQEFSSNKFSEDLAETSTRGKLDRAKDGRWCGGRVPYGYLLTFSADVGRNGRPVPDKLVPDPETAPIVAWLFACYATGQWSLRMLAEDLNRRGVPTPSAYRGEARAAALWSVPTIRGILTSEVYLGSAVWNRTHQGRFMGVVKLKVEKRPCAGQRRTVRNDPSEYVRVADRHEALVNEATFLLCQTRLVEGQKNTTPCRGGGDLVLSRLLWCGHCERRMTGRHSRGVPIYLCGSYLQYGKSACNYNSLEQADLVRAITKKFRERFTPAFFDCCRTALLAEIEAGRPAANSDNLARRVAELDAALERAAKRVVMEEDEGLAAEYRKVAQGIKQERDRLAAELAAARRAEEEEGDPAAEVDRALALAGHLQDVMEKATLAEQRAILHDHIERVELWFDHEQAGRETHCTFARGLIWLREDSPFAFCLSTSLGTSSGSGTASTSTAGTRTRATSRSSRTGTCRNSTRPWRRCWPT